MKNKHIIFYLISIVILFLIIIAYVEMVKDLGFMLATVICISAPFGAKAIEKLRKKILKY